MIYQTKQQKQSMKLQMKKQLRIRLKIAIALTLILVFVFNASACSGIKQYLWPEPTTAAPAAPTSDITIIPGWSVVQIAEELEKKNVCTADSFLNACKVIPAGYDDLAEGLSSASGYIFAAEGLIIPETINMYQDRDGDYALRTLLNYSQSELKKIENDGMTAFARAEQLDMSIYEVLTLASIIQYEANLGATEKDLETMQMVSSVFTNRLNNSANFPYIGSDATRKYVEVKMKDYLTSIGATEGTAQYNKYFEGYCTNDQYDLKTKGLPVGPVGCPSVSAIKAALWPSTSNNYYFFTDVDNNFHFYTNLNDFQTEWNTKYKH